MNYKFEVDGGGLFSRLLQCAIVPLADLKFEKVYLTARPLPPVNIVDPHVRAGIDYVHKTAELLREHGIVDPWDSIFNFILIQDQKEVQDGGILPVGRFYNHGFKIEESYNFKNYKRVYNILNVRPEIKEQSQIVLKNHKNILGVHVRLKDSNSVDDPKQFQDYVDAINYNLKNYNYSRIFVSSDNLLSINKLERLYPGMILSNNLARSDNEEADSFIWEYKNYFRRHYWVDAMIDCLTLSQCHTLICKNSNYANASIVFGDFKHIHRI